MKIKYLLKFSGRTFLAVWQPNLIAELVMGLAGIIIDIRFLDAGTTG
jgi:hypothetical protein